MVGNSSADFKYTNRVNDRRTQPGNTPPPSDASTEEKIVRDPTPNERALSGTTPFELIAFQGDGSGEGGGGGDVISVGPGTQLPDGLPASESPSNLRPLSAMSPTVQDAREEAESFNDLYDSLSPSERLVHGVSSFGSALARNADNPEWQAAYIDAIDEDHLASVLDNASNPASYFGLTTGSHEQTNLRAITQGLGSAYEFGALTDASISQLNSTWLDTYNGQMPPSVAELFASSTNPDLKAAFAQDMLSRWQNGEGDSASVAAAASHVLGHHSNTSQQIDTLVELDESDDLVSFIADASAGSMTQDDTFSHANNTDPSYYNYGGVTELIETVSRRELSNGALSPLPADREVLESLSVDIFDGAADGLRDNAHLQNNVRFKDALSTLVTSNFDHLVGNSIKNNGSIDAGFGDDFETFSHHVMFGTPPGRNQKFTAGFVADKIGEYTALSEAGDLSDRVTIGDASRSRLAVANISGQLLAHSLNGLQFAVEDGNARAAENDAAVGFLVNVAFDLLPVPKAGDVAEAIFSQGKGQVKSELLDALSSGDAKIDAQGFSVLYETIRNNIGVNNTEATAESLRGSFEDGFTGVRPVDVGRP